MADRKIFVSGDLTSDDKFKEAIEQVEKKGFILSHRTGDTGVGKTLEDELGVKENSVQAADLGEIELKATRRDSNSKLTLFTKAPKKRGVNSRVLRAQYGYQTDESRALNPNINILHTQVNGRDFNTLNGEPFLKLTARDDRLYLEHAKDGILEDVYWEQEQLKKTFDKKYPSKKLYHVQAEAKKEDDGSESFHYSAAYSLEDFSAERMIEGLKSGELDVDIRLGVYASGDRKGKPHDNGTAIRVSSKKLDECFDKKKKLL